MQSDFVTFIDESDEYHTFRTSMICHVHWGGILTDGSICLTNIFDKDDTEIISIDHRVETNRRSLIQLAGDVARIATFDLSDSEEISEEPDEPLEEEE